ncbi:MAG: c-type cytochrome [Alphaproteobacteria bacterium]|jgi:DMSO reductase family type II enzyme heme b subunit|nr:c-type cytochrome [Alphaproteobacteria bacterium]MDP6567399.1 c-type cytochrome [Alphaproteobacteria bacterium]MDP6813001.1 c-type cytochrome [Alphaproteobacteria bacterium]
MKLILAAALVVVCGLAAPVQAKPGNAENGEKIYEKRCLGCHGEEGDGLGPAAEYLIPPPRDFTLGLYKIKTTAFDDDIPNDDDLFRMIRDGMPGTAMPGWSDMLSEQEIWDLVAHLKIYAGLEEETPSKQLDYGSQVATSEDSVEKGRKLFHDGDRCSECHGAEGKGDAIKKLKNDNGDRTWPRNLTKPWTYRASSDPKDIYARISVGIPNTQMPSFADPKSKKKLSVEERWHIANYVVALTKKGLEVRPENTVVKAKRIDGEIPAAIDDQAWLQSEPVTFMLVPQIIAKDRFFTPANDTISVRALYNERDIAFLLEWDDRTKSIPGDAKAESIADPEMGQDAVMMQFPVTIPLGAEKPYFLKGDAGHPVNLWHWTSGTTEAEAAVAMLDGLGMAQQTPREDGGGGLTTGSGYQDGTWRVIMKRSLTTDDAENDLQFEEGRFIPIAFANWDGSNSEIDSRQTITTWYWLQLEPSASAEPYISGIVVALLVFGALVWWARGAARPGEAA